MKKYVLSLLFFLGTGTFAFAQEDSSSAQSGGLSQMLIMIGIAVIFFYFILLRPEKKRRKAAEEQRNSIQKGDKVTAMGIIGTVDKVTEATLILKMVDGAKIEMLKAAVTNVQKATSASPSELSSNES